MPELDWYYGYPACLGAMAVTAGVLVYYFYRKGWLTPREVSTFADAANAMERKSLPGERRSRPFSS
jgi:hypothetical protein